MPPSDQMSQMSLQIKRGLSEFGYSDHYAVLGLGVDASAGEIRKRYLQLARALHPDSSTNTDKAKSSQILSKLVNPAYQFLSQDKERGDYSMLLKLLGQRANLEFDFSKLQSSAAKELLKTEHFEQFYLDTVQALGAQQYLHLDQVVPITEQLSEINLVYLLRKEKAPMPMATSPTFAEPPAPEIQSQPSSPEVSVMSMPKETIEKKVSASAAGDFVKQYLRRAENLISKNCYADAVLELRDALRLDPQNSRCHALMGTVYLKQNQPKMAKGHLTQALKLDPNNAEARQAMTELTKLEAKATSTVQASAKATQTKGVKPTTERRGLFGLFGGKK
ncbi:MAG TPA: DnaJ domain-containing protein [Stenomitos sp.]